MHASAIAAAPGVIYWLGATVEVMAAVRGLRASGTGAWSTIDAGPHVKVLCAPRGCGGAWREARVRCPACCGSSSAPGPGEGARWCPGDRVGAWQAGAVGGVRGAGRGSGGGHGGRTASAGRRVEAGRFLEPRAEGGLRGRGAPLVDTQQHADGRAQAGAGVERGGAGGGARGARAGAGARAAGRGAGQHRRPRPTRRTGAAQGGGSGVDIVRRPTAPRVTLDLPDAARGRPRKRARASSRAGSCGGVVDAPTARARATASTRVRLLSPADYDRLTGPAREGATRGDGAGEATGPKRWPGRCGAGDARAGAGGGVDLVEALAAQEGPRRGPRSVPIFCRRTLQRIAAMPAGAVVAPAAAGGDVALHFGLGPDGLPGAIAVRAAGARARALAARRGRRCGPSPSWPSYVNGLLACSPTTRSTVQIAHGSSHVPPPCVLQDLHPRAPRRVAGATGVSRRRDRGLPGRRRPPQRGRPTSSSRTCWAPTPCPTASCSTCGSTATTTWRPWSSRSRAWWPRPPAPPRWCAAAGDSPPRPTRR